MSQINDHEEIYGKYEDDSYVLSMVESLMV